MRLKLPIALSFLVLQACGQEHRDHSQLTAAFDELPPVFLLMGGRTSCVRDSKKGGYTPIGMNAFQKLQTVLDEVVQRGASLPFIASCYTSSQDVYYVKSDNPEAVMTAPNEEFLGLAADYSHEVASGRAVVAGHSYGGWLGMQAVLHDGFTTDALFTLDAISQIHCTPSRLAGCGEAPRDISPDQRQAIAEETDLWGNYYQRNDWFIRSNAMSQADRNIDLDCNHNEVDEHDTVWQAIRARVLTALGLSLQS